MEKGKEEQKVETGSTSIQWISLSGMVMHMWIRVALG